jgi:hypothetical protein
LEENFTENLFLEELETENNYEKIFDKNNFIYYLRDANNTLLK